MKFAIASDFHLGYNDDALEQARRCMREACEKADFVILAGDLFDARVPKQETVHDAVKLYKEFSAKLRTSGGGKIVVKEIFGGSGARGGSAGSGGVGGVPEKVLDAAPLLGIYGTHERRAKGLSNIIQVLDDGGLMVNLHARKIVVEHVGGGKRERVCVQAMGGVPEEMAKKAIELLEFRPEQGCFNVFVFHQSVRELIPQDESALSMADLPQGFDLYVNGHIHWRQELDEAGKKLLIPGSTVVTQMKESETHPKGFFLYDSEKRSADFHEIHTRPFVFKQLEFKAAHPAEVEKACREFLEKVAQEHADEMPLVKLKLVGTLAPGLSASTLDVTKLEKEYADKIILNVDKQVGALEMREKIELLRRIREEKAGAKEMGLDVLKKLLKQNGAEKELGGPQEIEELFELLSQGEVEKAVEKVLASGEK